MKPLERIPFLSNVLIVACARPNAEVGKLVKAVLTYVTEGTKPTLEDIRLEAYFDLLVQDLDAQRAAAEVKSKKCSESAKSRIAKNAGGSSNGANATKMASPATSARKANASNATATTKPANAAIAGDSDNANASGSPMAGSNADEQLTTGILGSGAANAIHASDVASDGRNGEVATANESNDFNATDDISSFEQIKLTYGKIGDNVSQAFGVWQKLTESERMTAFAHTQRMQGDLTSRSYLYVYLRDKEWTRAAMPGNA